MMIKDGTVENTYLRKAREEDEWNRMVNGCVKNLEWDHIKLHLQKTKELLSDEVLEVTNFKKCERKQSILKNFA